MEKHVNIFDTTLRDGVQAPGNTLSVQQKVVLFHEICKTNVDIVEVGFPASSRDELQACQLVRKTNPDVTLSVFARAKEEDINIAAQVLHPIQNHQIQIALTGSENHLKYKRKISPQQSIAEASEAIQLAQKFGFNNISAAFEDTTRGDINYLLYVVKASISSGATTIVLADTVGYAQPDEVFSLVSQVRSVIGKDINLSIHCHNDMGLATANALAAIKGGASDVQTTFCGIGERSGNTPIEELITTLYTRHDFYNITTNIDLKALYTCCKKVAEAVGYSINNNKPIIGANAFATEAGIHGQGIIANPSTYEAFDPAILGRKRQLILGKYSGKSMIRQVFHDNGETLTTQQLQHLYNYLSATSANETFTGKNLQKLRTSATTMRNNHNG